MWCKEGKDCPNNLQKLLLVNTDPDNGSIILSLLYLGSAVLAFSISADIAAEEIWLWLYHYAQN